MKTKDDEINDLKYKTERYDHGKTSKPPKKDNECHKTKCESLNKKKVSLIITEILIGGGSTITSSTLSILNPSSGIVIV